MLDEQTLKVLKFLNQFDDLVPAYKLEKHLEDMNFDQLTFTLRQAGAEFLIQSNTARFKIRDSNDNKFMQKLIKEIETDCKLKNERYTDFRITPQGRRALVNHKKEVFQTYKLPVVAIIISIIALIFSGIAIIIELSRV